MDKDIETTRRELESGRQTPDSAFEMLVERARHHVVRAARIDAYRLLGDLAGRAFDAPWETAERAAWVLLEAARHVDAPAERGGLLRAMGRGFRNLWLMPFVHARLADDEPVVVAAAIAAAGGLGFAGLEEAVASRFLGEEVDATLKREAIASLGRMGAASAAPRLAAFLDGEPRLVAAALAALTEIRSSEGVTAAVAWLERSPPREILMAACRYLAELGRLEVVPTLRRLARDDDPELRTAASFASRALKAERSGDAAERILVALTERDRAVRALLARRLRTLPVKDVIAAAQELLSDDPEGVVQVVGEVRAPEITHFLLDVAGRADLPIQVRARAAFAVEANEPWEREALARLVAESKDETLRAAAARTMGAFASVAEVLRHLGPLADASSPALRGALLWALQLAARPAELRGGERADCERLLRRALVDEDVGVRRRAAYVAGNLHLESLARELASLARKEEQKPDLRVAAFTGLAELAAAASLDDLVVLLKREEDPEALLAASRALAAVVAHTEGRADLGRVHAKVLHLLKSDDARVREAAARVAGLCVGGVPASTLLPLVADVSPRVREAVLTALGRLADRAAEPALLGAMDDPDSAIHERAAEALLALGGPRPIERLLRYVSGEEDGTSRARIAARLALPTGEAHHYLPLLDAALKRLRHDDPAYEPLLDLKAKLFEIDRPEARDVGAVDAAILAAFPTYAQLSRVRGFVPLGRSLRTAEALYRGTTGLADADFSPPIMLWMKCLEGYVHAWLSPQLEALQRDPMMLCEHVDRLLGGAWNEYQRYLAERWTDSVDVGGVRVEVPLRAAANALREFQERRVKRLDATLSVTEWARLLLFFAVDHPSGVRRVFKVSSRNSDQVVRIAHRLQILAAVRNLVTHRSAAAASTLEAFRSSYYSAFEELTHLA